MSKVGLCRRTEGDGVVTLGGSAGVKLIQHHVDRRCGVRIRLTPLLLQLPAEGRRIGFSCLFCLGSPAEDVSQAVQHCPRCLGPPPGAVPPALRRCTKALRAPTCRIVSAKAVSRSILCWCCSSGRSGVRVHRPPLPHAAPAAARGSRVDISFSAMDSLQVLSAAPSCFCHSLAVQNWPQTRLHVSACQKTYV